MSRGEGWSQGRDRVVSEHSEDRKWAELGDSVDWLWDVRQHDSYLERGWFYLAMFRVLGS